MFTSFLISIKCRFIFYCSILMMFSKKKILYFPPKIVKYFVDHIG